VKLHNQIVKKRKQRRNRKVVTPSGLLVRLSFVRLGQFQPAPANSDSTKPERLWATLWVRVAQERRNLNENRHLFFEWWAREDSNLQPSGYEPLALTIELRARATRAPARPDGFIATQTHDRLNDEGYATICHRLLMRPPQPGTSESGRSFTLGNDRDLHQQPDVRRGRSREAWRADASLRARRFVPVENAC
jgi:hypothetical protein